MSHKRYALHKKLPMKKIGQLQQKLNNNVSKCHNAGSYRKYLIYENMYENYVLYKKTSIPSQKKKVE